MALNFLKGIKLVHVAIIAGVLIVGMLIYNTSNSIKLQRQIGNWQGQLLILEELRKDLKDKRIADSLAKEQVIRQISLFEKMDKALDKSFELYAENLKSIKKKYNETISNITVYSSDDLKSYFANLPNPED